MDTQEVVLVENYTFDHINNSTTVQHLIKSKDTKLHWPFCAVIHDCMPCTVCVRAHACTHVCVCVCVCVRAMLYSECCSTCPVECRRAVDSSTIVLMASVSWQRIEASISYTLYYNWVYYHFL